MIPVMSKKQINIVLIMDFDNHVSLMSKKQINIVLIMDFDNHVFFGTRELFNPSPWTGFWLSDHIDNTMFHHQ
jgi:hypothetical protein